MFKLFAAAIVVVTLIGCGSSENCSVSNPASCPEAPPSYATDVAPLMTTYCTNCHAAGGEQANIPLTTLAELQARAGEVQSEIASCDMPPSDDAQPTDAERELILSWVVCGATAK